MSVESNRTARTRRFEGRSRANDVRYREEQRSYRASKRAGARTRAEQRAKVMKAIEDTVEAQRLAIRSLQGRREKLAAWAKSIGECYVCCEQLESCKDLAVFACGHTVHASCINQLRTSMCEAAFKFSETALRLEQALGYLQAGGPMTPELDAQIAEDVKVEAPSRKACGVECGICGFELNTPHAMVESPLRPLEPMDNRFRARVYVEHEDVRFYERVRQHRAFLDDALKIKEGSYDKHLAPPPPGDDCVVC